MTITIGPFTAGEIPAPLEYTFLKSDGTPIAGLADASFSFRADRGAPVMHDAVVDNTTGKATYAWGEDDLDHADALYVAEFWVTNGTERFASERIVFLVLAAVEAPDGS